MIASPHLLQQNRPDGVGGGVRDLRRLPLTEQNAQRGGRHQQEEALEKPGMREHLRRERQRLRLEELDEECKGAEKEMQD